MNASREELLQVLGELGELFPDWRFGQMIANVATSARGPHVEGIWDSEDEELLAAITSNENNKKEISLEGGNQDIKIESGGSVTEVKEQGSVSRGKEQGVYGGKEQGNVLSGTERVNKVDVVHEVSEKETRVCLDSGGALKPDMKSNERDLKEEGGSDKKRAGGVEEDEKWKLQCAVTYRLTRKHIVDTNL